MHSPEPTPTHPHSTTTSSAPPSSHTSRVGPPFTSLSQHLELDRKPLVPSPAARLVYMAKHPRDSAAGAVPLSLALSLGGGGGVAPEHSSSKRHRRAAAGGGDGGGEFVCKTCSRAFGSFQALGGHRTSHLRGRHGLELGMPAPAPAKDDAKETTTKQAMPASHLCHVCGLGFEMGQALGGHMRRHREEAAATTAQAPPVLLQLFV